MGLCGCKIKDIGEMNIEENIHNVHTNVEVLNPIISEINVQNNNQLNNKNDNSEGNLENNNSQDKFDTDQNINNEPNLKNNDINNISENDLSKNNISDIEFIIIIFGQIYFKYLLLKKLINFLNKNMSRRSFNNWIIYTNKTMLIIEKVIGLYINSSNT